MSGATFIYCSYEDAKCLVTTGVGKHYSLGLDLEWMGTQQVDAISSLLNDLQKLLARLLVFPMVTVAALNGKAIIYLCVSASQLDVSILH